MEIIGKSLEGGNVLRFLKHEFLTKQNKEALMPVLACLRDSDVIVPVRADLSKEDEERILSAKKGARIDSDKQIRFQPDLLQSDDGTFFPIFSNEQQLTPEYAAQFSMMKLPAPYCIRMMLALEDVDGLVLDAFTEAMIIPKQSAALILKMKSHLE